MKNLQLERDTDGSDLQLENESHSIRILLLDNYAIVRTGLRMLIDSWPGFTVVGDADLSAEATALALLEKPDIVLLGADGDDDGVGFIHKLAEASPQSRIIVLTDTQDRQVHQSALREGAMGVLQMEKAAEELRKSINCVHAGELWIDRSTTATLIAEIARADKRSDPDSAAAKLGLLTDREREVALQVCEGLRNEEIAIKLGISQTTVRHHISSILAKIAVANRLELIIFLYRHKFARSAR